MSSKEILEKSGWGETERKNRKIFIREILQNGVTNIYGSNLFSVSNHPVSNGNDKPSNGNDKPSNISFQKNNWGEGGNKKCSLKKGHL